MLGGLELDASGWMPGQCHLRGDWPHQLPQKHWAFLTPEPGARSSMHGARAAGGRRGRGWAAGASWCETSRASPAAWARPWGAWLAFLIYIENTSPFLYILRGLQGSLGVAPWCAGDFVATPAVGVHLGRLGRGFAAAMVKASCESVLRVAGLPRGRGSRRGRCFLWKLG